MKKIYNKYSYSKTGQWHKAHNQENQDAVYYFENDDIVFCAVADGVSSCENSKRGAELACELACRLCRYEYKYFFSIEKEIIKWLIVSYIQKHISSYAEKNGHAPESYASTLCFVCIDKYTDKMITFTLGDSRIYLVNGKNTVLCTDTASIREDNLTNTTMTVNAYYDVSVTFEVFTEGGSVLLCTDGVWRNTSELLTDMTECATLADHLDNALIADDSTFLYVA